MDINGFLESRIEHIDKIVQTTCRKKHIAGEQVNDFRSYVYLKLLENDGRRIRDFRGDYDASWSSYLTLVIARLAIDFTKKEWGRWEYSAQAKALGKVAMDFETLLFRDEYSFEEASQLMFDNPEFITLYRFSEEKRNRLDKEGLPEAMLAVLQGLNGNRVYLKSDFESELDALPIDDPEGHYREIIMEISAFSLERRLLEEWALLYQGRVPISEKAVDSMVRPADMESRELDFIENIPDSSEKDPLESVLEEELQDRLDRLIHGLLLELDDTDWAILSLFLVEGIRIAEIARMIGPYRIEDPCLAERKRRRLTNKNWKYINTRINSFLNRIKKQVETMKLEKSDRDSVVRYCMFVISKKIAEKANYPSSN
ncbi:MAG: hypothetical protein GY866_23900 [Proteobacteria bacterium]|nr:hypothetical protein [Pseudomonadota bacterium]